MWLPNRLLSKNIEIIKITYDENNVDEYNRPVPVIEHIPKTAEVIPYTNVIERQTIGITNKTAYKINFETDTAIDNDDIVDIDGKGFKVAEIQDFNIIKGFPLQIVVESTGETSADYINQRVVVSNG